MHFLREWIQEIVILMVLATVIDLCLPNGSLKKYVDYALGLMLLLLLLTPVISLLEGQLDVDALLNSAEQRTALAGVTAEPLSDKSAWLAYRLVFEGRVVALCRANGSVENVRASVTLDQNSSSPTFGKPKHIGIVVKIKSSSDEQAALRDLRESLRLTYSLDISQISIQIER